MFAKSIKTLVQKLNKVAYLPGIAFAEIVEHPKDIVDSPEKIEEIFNSVASWFFTIFLIVAVIGLVYTAFMYLTAAGDESKIKKARTSLTFAIVAIVIALLAGGAPTLIQNILENRQTYPDTGGDCPPPGPC